MSMITDEVNGKARTLLEHYSFLPKVLMRLLTYLSGWIGILKSLKRLVVPSVHPFLICTLSMLDLFVKNNL